MVGGSSVQFRNTYLAFSDVLIEELDEVNDFKVRLPAK